MSNRGDDCSVVGACISFLVMPVGYYMSCLSMNGVEHLSFDAEAD